MIIWVVVVIPCLKMPPWQFYESWKKKPESLLNSWWTTVFRFRLLKVTFKGHKNFYSASHSSEYPFLDCFLSEVKKTGLGSSAAFISSYVAAVFSFNGITDIKLIYRASQFIHSLVQGKVGSGFDVACALFGSCIYKRFDENLIGGALDNSSFSNILSSECDL